MELDEDVVERSADDVIELDDEDAVELDQGFSPTTTSAAVKNHPKPKAGRQYLRTLERSDRCFWKTSHSAQLDQTIFDKSSDGTSRQIPSNEIAVMALNEIAVHHKRGFFLHFKGRDGWKKRPSEELCPASRISPQPGAQFPNIVYMNYIWSDTSRANFFKSSHRSQYLACDGLINPPANNTPLYAIQYAAHATYAVYATSAESLIVFATPSTFYVGTSSELEEVIGLWPKKKRALVSLDPHVRLNTTPSLWQQSALEKADQNGKQIYDAMQDFKVEDVKALYDEIIQQCRPGGIRSTFTADELRQTIPRPVAPEAGIPLGTPFNSSLASTESIPESSNPPSRQGGRLQRGGHAGSAARGNGRRGKRREKMKE